MATATASTPLTASEPLMMLTALIMATMLKYFSGVIERSALGYRTAAVPPPWVGTVLSVVLKALAVLTTALVIALALAPTLIMLLLSR